MLMNEISIFIEAFMCPPISASMYIFDTSGKLIDFCSHYPKITCFEISNLSKVFIKKLTTVSDKLILDVFFVGSSITDTSKLSCTQ